MTTKDKPAAAMLAAGQVASHMPEMLLALTRVQATVFDAVMRQNIEWLDFLKARFERDRQLVARIGQSGDPAEAAKLWSEFWRTAFDDYSGEPQRMSDIARTTLTAALAKARHDAEDLMQPTRSTAL